jgi:hypothetical protein
MKSEIRRNNTIKTLEKCRQNPAKKDKTLVLSFFMSPPLLSILLQ